MRYNYLIECLGDIRTTIRNADDINFDTNAPFIIINDEIKREKTIINMKNVVRIIRKEEEDE